MKGIVILLLLFLQLTLQAQIITSFAGSGTGIYPSDGGLATAGRLLCPEDINIDKFGNMYITESLNHRIRRIDIHNIITTIAGTGSAGFSGDSGLAPSAKLNYPSGITSDTFGNIYFCDQSNNRIRKIDVGSDIITTVAGNGLAAYIGDGIIATATSLNDPYGVYYDKLTGGLYVADNANHRVRFINSSGIISTVVGTGVMSSLGDGGPATAASCCPITICKDNAGNLYISDGCSRKVRKVNLSGTISTIAGNDTGTIYNGDGIPATIANIVPGYIYVDASGILYIPDNYNHRVRKVDGSGVIQTIAGNGITAYTGDNGPATAASINQPNALAMDQCGNLYIAQINTPRIRKVAYSTSPSITLYGSTSVALGSTVTITATVTNAGSGYSINWYNKGMLFSTTTVPVTSYTKSAGADTITATVYGCGSSAASVQHIVTVAIDHTGISNTTPGTGDIKLWPNPVTGILHISNAPPGSSYVICEMTGRAVATGVLNKKDDEIDMAHIAKGIYLLQVQQADGRKAVYKVVKE